jgi:hypothetical protein
MAAGEGDSQRPGGDNNMANSEIEIRNMVQQHRATQAHIKFLIHAVGRLDPQLYQGMADATSLKNRIALYRWSLYDFKEAMQRHDETDQRIFEGRRSLAGILKEHRGIMEQISNAITLMESAINNTLFREELNVYLVKTTLAVNKICETIELHLAGEDELVRQLQKTSPARTR